MDKQVGCDILHDRGLLEIRGEEAATFLQTLITTDIEHMHKGIMMAGALLSPQGKVLFDFLVGWEERQGEKYFVIDSPRLLIENLIKRLNLYKLRSKVEIVPCPAIAVRIEPIQMIEGTSEGEEKSAKTALDQHNKHMFIDGRLLAANIMRIYDDETSSEQIGQGGQQWHSLRIEQAIAESGLDFMPGEVFPHDINLDQIGGLSFKKGCYIGQEVVSRMHHRGTARRRLVLIHANEPLAEQDSAIEAAGKVLGAMGSSVARGDKFFGLALVRLDRVKAAQDREQEITCGGKIVSLEIPKRVNFTYPKTEQEEGKDGKS